MRYEVGMKLIWTPKRAYEPVEVVEVVEVKSRGQARLSNGWTVGDDGIASGTPRTPGGSVKLIQTNEVQNVA